VVIEALANGVGAGLALGLWTLMTLLADAGA
jgi:hypothetical protein